MILTNVPISGTNSLSCSGGVLTAGFLNLKSDHFKFSWRAFPMSALVGPFKLK